MFYNLIYRSFLWNKDKKDIRNIKVFVTGTVLYVAAYFSLNTQYAQIDFIQKYRKYFYHLLAIDLALTAAQMLFAQPTPKSKKRKTNRRQKIPPIFVPNNFLLNQPMADHIPKSMSGLVPTIGPVHNTGLVPTGPVHTTDHKVTLPVYSGSTNKKINNDEVEEEQFNIPIYQPLYQPLNQEVTSN